MHVQSCCFCHQTYCFFDVMVTFDVVVRKKNHMSERTILRTKLQHLVVQGYAYTVRYSFSLRMKSYLV